MQLHIFHYRLFVTTMVACLIMPQEPSFGSEPATPIHIEAESGVLNGTTISTDRPGYTGSSYVTGVSKSTDSDTLTINNVTPGIYDVLIYYSAPSLKGYNLTVNGSGYDGTFQSSGDAFVGLSLGAFLRAETSSAPYKGVGQSLACTERSRMCLRPLSDSLLYSSESPHLLYMMAALFS